MAKGTDCKTVLMTLMLDGLPSVKKLDASTEVLRKTASELPPQLDKDLAASFKAWIADTVGEKGTRGRQPPKVGEYRDYTISKGGKDPFVRVPLSALQSLIGDEKARVHFEEDGCRVGKVPPKAAKK
jgi:hypothetical protein